MAHCGCFVFQDDGVLMVRGSVREKTRRQQSGQAKDREEGNTMDREAMVCEGEVPRDGALKMHKAARMGLRP